MYINNQDTAQKWPHFICSPGPRGQKVVSPADSYTLRRGPATLAISRLAPCSAPKRPLNGPTRDLHPSRWQPHPFPADSGLGFCMGCLQAQTNPNMVPLHSAIFPQSMHIPGKLGWSGGKPGSGVTNTTAYSEAWATWALVLCQAQSPHLLNGSFGSHLMKGRKD